MASYGVRDRMVLLKQQLRLTIIIPVCQMKTNVIVIPGVQTKPLSAPGLLAGQVIQLPPLVSFQR